MAEGALKLRVGREQGQGPAVGQRAEGPAEFPIELLSLPLLQDTLAIGRVGDEPAVGGLTAEPEGVRHLEADQILHAGLFSIGTGDGHRLGVDIPAPDVVGPVKFPVHGLVCGVHPGPRGKKAPLLCGKGAVQAGSAVFGDEGGLDGNGAGTAKGVAERIAAPVFGEEHHGGGQSLPQRRRDAHRPIAPFVEAGARYLHVVDLDGAKDGTLSNYGSIAALAKQGGLYIEVGGGIRTEERIEKYLSLGVNRCILGSVAVTDFDFTARMLKRYGERIAVGVDAKDGFVAIHGWKEVSAEKGVDFCRRLADAGCTAIIYTDIACDGAMQGTNLTLYRQLAKEVPGVAFTASGGISSETELLELQQMGTAAAILGKSLYTGALDLARCVQLVQD